MSQARTLVLALATIASRFSPRDARGKTGLLERLMSVPLGEPSLLRRLHEALCFLQAYPDSAAVLDRVDRALTGFPARVERLGVAVRSRLHDTGIAGTTLEYPFGFPMARWLVSRFPADVEVAWERFRGGGELDEVLPLLVSHAEDDSFSEGGPGWRQWLRAAKGAKQVTDLGALVRLLEQAALPDEVRDRLFESLALPVRWRLRRMGASRTLAKLPWAHPFFHRAGLWGGGAGFVREVTRPLAGLRRAPRSRAEALIETARTAVATRLRELHGFSYANPDDVLVAEPGRGLQIALIGLLPRFRLPLEGYYAFLVLKNGVPVSYGGGWEMFGTLELGLNIFASFRRGESAFTFGQVLRLYHRALRMRTVSVDPYQLGHDNPEALRSGAFYFYHHLGFRPRDPAVLRLSEQELARIARRPSYRTPLAGLRRLARAEMYLTLPGGSPAPERRLRASQVAALVTRHIEREFNGDRGAAVRAASAGVAHALGVPRWTAWPPDERRAFERLSLVAALIPDLPRWPGGDRERLVRVLRAKGGPSELAYVRLLDGHHRFRRSLEALAGRNGPGG